MAVLKKFSIVEKRILLISFLLNLVVAWLCKGYYHPDEHFQVLEFANYKLGFSPASELPWEFAEKIRPTLLPSLAFVVARAFLWFDAYNPFTVIFLLRCITAVLSFLATIMVLNLSSAYIRDKRHRFYLLLLSCFLWFNPYLEIHFASEIWSGIFFTVGLCLAVPLFEQPEISFKKALPTLLFVGVLWGISFWCRFQIAFAIAGLALWILFFRRRKWLYLFLPLVSFAVVVVCCIQLDSWFYDTFVITPQRYYVINIVQNIAATRWGSQPWYFYFIAFLGNGVPPGSLILLGLVIASFATRYDNPLLWPLAFFVVGHVVVAHKELRFLFPMIFLLPVCAILCLEAPSFIARLEKIPARVLRAILRVTVTVNILALAFVIMRNTTGISGLYKYLYDRVEQKPATIVTLTDGPFVSGDLVINYYKPPNLKMVKITEPDSLLSYFKRNTANVYLFHDGTALPADLDSLHAFTRVYTTSPRILEFKGIRGKVSKFSTWSLYQAKAVTDRQ